jgi:hypothetical protein
VILSPSSCVTVSPSSLCDPEPPSKPKVIPSRCEGTSAATLLEDIGDPAQETGAEHLWSRRTAVGMDHGSHEEILRLRVQDDHAEERLG